MGVARCAPLQPHKRSWLRVSMCCNPTGAAATPLWRWGRVLLRAACYVLRATCCAMPDVYFTATLRCRSRPEWLASMYASMTSRPVWSFLHDRRQRHPRRSAPPSNRFFPNPVHQPSLKPRPARDASLKPVLLDAASACGPGVQHSGRRPVCEATAGPGGCGGHSPQRSGAGAHTATLLHSPHLRSLVRYTYASEAAYRNQIQDWTRQDRRTR